MRRENRNVPVWICVPSRLPSAPNTLPRMPIAAGTRTTQAGKQVEGVADDGEGDAGDEIATRGDQERDEARADSGDVRADERDEARADTTWKTGHEELGGSAIGIDLRNSPEPEKFTPESGESATNVTRSEVTSTDQNSDT